MTTLLTAMMMMLPSAVAADKACPGVDWAKIKDQWGKYDKGPSEKLEKELLTQLPVDLQEMDGCPSFTEAYSLISTHLKGLQKRVSTGTKSPLCLTFRLQAFANGAFAGELEKLSNEGLKKQKGLDQLAFQNACMTQRKPLNPANYEEKLAEGKMAPNAKDCDKELERFMDAKKKWEKAVAEAPNKNRCLLVLKKVSASSPKNALCTGISELLSSVRSSLEAKCAKMDD